MTDTKTYLKTNQQQLERLLIVSQIIKYGKFIASPIISFWTASLVVRVPASISLNEKYNKNI